MTNYFTMIGSRDTPEHKRYELRDLAKAYSEAGWIGRSGGAWGADTCLEEGAPDSPKEIYLPWDNFNGRKHDKNTFFALNYSSRKGEAEWIAMCTHPAWERCSLAARQLHSRNVFQILGKDLETPSRCVICYAQPVGKKGYVKGGTATAVKLAIDEGIPVFNLWNDNAFDEAMEFLNE